MLAVNTKRPYYRTKAEWAAAKARELRQEARLMPTVPSANWQAVRRRMTALRTLRAEADRLEKLAERFRAQGV